MRAIRSRVQHIFGCTDEAWSQLGAIGPQQEDGYNCGIFAITAGRALLREMHITSPSKPHVRRRQILNLFRNNLWRLLRMNGFTVARQSVRAAIAGQPIAHPTATFQSALHLVASSQHATDRPGVAAQPILGPVASTSSRRAPGRPGVAVQPMSGPVASTSSRQAPDRLEMAAQPVSGQVASSSSQQNISHPIESYVGYGQNIVGSLIIYEQPKDWQERMDERFKSDDQDVPSRVSFDTILNRQFPRLYDYKHQQYDPDNLTQSIGGYRRIVYETEDPTLVHPVRKDVPPPLTDGVHWTVVRADCTRGRLSFEYWDVDLVAGTSKKSNSLHPDIQPCMAVAEGWSEFLLLTTKAALFAAHDVSVARFAQMFCKCKNIRDRHPVVAVARKDLVLSKFTPNNKHCQDAIGIAPSQGRRNTASSIDRAQDFTISVETCLAWQKAHRPGERPMLASMGIDGFTSSMVNFDLWARTLTTNFDFILSAQGTDVTFVDGDRNSFVQPAQVGRYAWWHMASEDREMCKGVLIGLVDT